MSVLQKQLQMNHQTLCQLPTSCWMPETNMKMKLISNAQVTNVKRQYQQKLKWNLMVMLWMKTEANRMDRLNWNVEITKLTVRSLMESSSAKQHFSMTLNNANWSWTTIKTNFQWTSLMNRINRVIWFARKILVYSSMRLLY